MKYLLILLLLVSPAWADDVDTMIKMKELRAILENNTPAPDEEIQFLLDALTPELQRATKNWLIETVHYIVITEYPSSQWLEKQTLMEAGSKAGKKIAQQEEAILTMGDRYDEMMRSYSGQQQPQQKPQPVQYQPQPQEQPRNNGTAKAVGKGLLWLVKTEIESQREYQNKTKCQWSQYGGNCY